MPVPGLVSNSPRPCRTRRPKSSIPYLRSAAFFQNVFPPEMYRTK